MDCDNNPVIVETKTEVHKEMEDDIVEPSTSSISVPSLPGG